MATTLVTGAEEVGWDLADLYGGVDDARIDADVAQAEADAAAFRDQYYGNVGGLDAAGLAAAVTEHERIEAVMVRALTYAHLHFATNMADPARGALVARLRREGGHARDAAALLRARVGRARGRRRGGAPRRRRARPLAPPPARAAQVPPVPPVGARGEDRHREDRLRRRGLVAPLRGAARRAAGAARRRGPLARDGDGPALRARPRHAPWGRGGDHGGARPRPPDAHLRVQHDPPGQGDRRPAPRLPDAGSRRGTSRTRRPTRPSRR